MFTYDDIRTLLDTRPFSPFRILTSDGSRIEVPSREMVLPFRRFAVIGILDPTAPDQPMDKWTTVWYFHIAKVEQLQAGSPPFSSPPTTGGEVVPV